MDRVEISDKIEVWDEKLDDWRLTSEKVSHPTLRQGFIAIPLKFMDFCDI